MKVKAEEEEWSGAENKCETDRRQRQQMDQEAVERGRGTQPLFSLVLIYFPGLSALCFFRCLPACASV